MTTAFEKRGPDVNLCSLTTAPGGRAEECGAAEPVTWGGVVLDVDVASLDVVDVIKLVKVRLADPRNTSRLFLTGRVVRDVSAQRDTRWPCNERSRAHRPEDV